MEEKLKKIIELTKEILYELKAPKNHNNSKKIPRSEKTFDLGLFQGSKSTAFSIAKKLILLGFSVEDVSSITELSAFEIKNFIDFN